MNAIYHYTGISKQNFHQRLRRQESKLDELAQLEWLIYQIRDDHPGMGAEKLYYKMQPECVGRDGFLQFYRDKGFCIEKQKNYRKTTDSTGVARFPNLLDGLNVTFVNQVWVSDITYYHLNDQFYYLTFIMDLHSRYIVGYAASTRLLTVHTTVPAMRMALKYLPKQSIPIIHSDGGGQYYSNKFLHLIKNTCKSSMAMMVYENIHAERINGTIKNEYIRHWEPKNFKELARGLKRAVNNYNNDRPHRSLNLQTPEQVFFNEPSVQVIKKRLKKSNKQNKLHLQTR